MKPKKKIVISDEEKKLPYYKYYTRPLAAIPKEKLDILKVEKPTWKGIIPFEKKDIFLKGEDKDYCQLGYGNLEDGTGYVCNTTFFPNSTVEMIDWWFPWHSIGPNLRYTIWDNEDHYFANADNVEYVKDPKVPMNQKTWGVSHYIYEDVGMGPSLIKINFKRPKDFGLDESIIGSKYCKSLVCGIGEGECAAAMIHKWYDVEGGLMLCSRFWIGMCEKNGKIISNLPKDVKVPIEVSRGLFEHNCKEFTNLASILPELYKENKDNF